MLSIIDAYFGYRQIRMYAPDEEKTTFVSNRANYCYRVMPFGLKNAGATYQRLMDKVFEGQIGRHMEVFVDYIVVKSEKPSQHASDLNEIISKLKKYNMRLNVEKYNFGIKIRKFLGFMLTHKGIEANPDKCKAIIEMRRPTNVKEMQRLAGRLASLSCFLSRLA